MDIELDSKGKVMLGHGPLQFRQTTSWVREKGQIKIKRKRKCVRQPEHGKQEDLPLGNYCREEIGIFRKEVGGLNSRYHHISRIQPKQC